MLVGTICMRFSIKLSRINQWLITISSPIQSVFLEVLCSDWRYVATCQISKTSPKRMDVLPWKSSHRNFQNHPKRSGFYQSCSHILFLGPATVGPYGVYHGIMNKMVGNCGKYTNLINCIKYSCFHISASVKPPTKQLR